MRAHSLVVVFFFWKVVFGLSLFTVLIGYVLALLITLKNRTKVFSPLPQSSTALQPFTSWYFSQVLFMRGAFFFLSSQVLVLSTHRVRVFLSARAGALGCVPAHVGARFVRANPELRAD